MSALATFPTMAYQICLNQDPNDPSPPAAVWTDFSTRVIGNWTASRGRQYELGRTETGEWTPHVRNNDGAFNPTSANTLAGLKNYRQVRALASWGANRLPDAQSVSPMQTGPAGTQWDSLPSGATLQTAYAILGPLGQYGPGVLTCTTAGTVQVLSRPFTVTATHTYAFGGSFMAATAGRLVRVGVNWYSDAGGNTLISSTAGVAVSDVAGSWTISTATAAAPGTAVTARLVVVGSSLILGEQHYIGAMFCVDQAANTTAGWQPDGTQKSVFAGLAERYPQAWDLDGTYGVCDPPVVDVLSTLANVDLNGCLASEAISDGAISFYPLNEAAGSPSAGSLAGASVPNAVIRVGKNGVPTATFGNTSIVSDLGTSFAVTGGNSNGLVGAAVELAGPDLGGQTIYSQGALEVWWVLPSSSTSAQPQVPISQHSPSGTIHMQVEIGVNNKVFFDCVGFTSGGLGPAVDAHGAQVIGNDGKLHYAAMSLGVDGKTISCYLDGVLQGTLVMAVAAAWSGDVVSVGGQWVPTLGVVAAGVTTGSFAAAGVYLSPLTATQVANHYNAGTTMFAGETSGARVSRLLRYAGYTRTAAVDVGVSTMAAASGLDGVKALDALQAVADSEQGNLYADASGVLTFRSRQARYGQMQPLWGFGSNVAAGEIPFLDGVQLDIDPQYVFNQVETSRTGGVTVRVQDAASVLSYFPRQTSLAMTVDTDDQVADMANFMLQRYKQPQLRLSSLQFSPATHPRAWYAALHMELGDRVRVAQRPVDGQPAVTLDGFVEKITHNVSGGQWTVEVLVSPAGPYAYFVLGAFRATLNAPSLSGANTLVLNPNVDSTWNPIEADVLPGQLLTINANSLNPQTICVMSVTSSTPGKAGYATATLTVAGLTTTTPNTLTGALPLGNTVLTLTSASNVATTHLLIDGELMPVASGAGTVNVTVTRNAIVSQSAHSGGATVYEVGTGVGVSSSQAAGALLCEALPLNGSGFPVVNDPTYWDPVAQLGTLSSTVASLIGSVLTTSQYVDYPTNTGAADIGVGVTVVVDPATTAEKFTVAAVADAGGGLTALTLGAPLTAASAAGALLVTVAALARGWTVGQKVSEASLLPANFGTVSAITDNHDGTTTLTLTNTGTGLAAMTAGQQLYQYAASSHVPGATVIETVTTGTAAIPGTARLAA